MMLQDPNQEPVRVIGDGWALAYSSAVRIAASPFSAVVLIAVYSPTATPQNQSGVIQFYDTLSAFIASLDANTPYIILGDLNATMAPRGVRGCCFRTTNDKPKLYTRYLTNFVLSHDVFEVSPRLPAPLL